MELDILTGGTGKALEFGRLGEVDAIAIHDRVREEAFIAEGYGVERHPIAYNYFLIVGPESDPAGISKLAPEEALSEVMRRGQGSGDRVWFVSRGDESGTHAREKLLWEKAGYSYDTVRDSGSWYLESGAGMGAVLLLADEKEAYTLTDAGTFLAFKKDLDLTPLVESGDSLLNVYSVIAVSPERFPDANSDMADRLIQFLTSEECAGPDRGPRRKRVWGGRCLLPHEDKSLNERPSTSPVVPVQACPVPDTGTGVHSSPPYPCRVQLGRSLTSWTWCWTAFSPPSSSSLPETGRYSA